MAISLAAGDVLTAARFNALVPMYLVQGSDQNLTTSAANHNTFANIAFDANSTWAVTVYLDTYNSSGATTDIQTAWSVTGGTVQGKRHCIGLAQNLGAVTGDVILQARTSATVTVGTTTTTGGTHASQREDFLVTSTTAGTLTLSVSTDTGTATIVAGSYLVAHRVS